MGHAIFINPDFIFIGNKPRIISLDRLAIDKDGRGRSLVPYLKVELMATFGHLESLGHAELQLAVKREIKLPFAGNGDGLSLRQFKSL